MDLLVPAIFEEGFLEALAELPVFALYGSLPEEAGLRPGRWLSPVDEEGLASYIARARGLGLRFYYTLNAACLGNREWTAEGQRWLVERLGWLTEVGAEGVVVANPYLLAFIKARFPRLRVAISTAAGVDSVDKALFFAHQGADILYLPEYINRDFPLLKEMRQRVPCDLVLLANIGCLLHCPLRWAHIVLVSHSGESLERGTFVDYPLLWCTQEKALNPAQMVKAPWVRPEDLKVYEAIGYEHFKIAGREMGAEWVLRAVKAYACRQYEGDLNDLVLGLDHLEPLGRLPFRLDNRKLEGFITFFYQKSDCRLGCRDCTYCDRWARQAVRVEGKPNAFIHRASAWIRRFERGAFRTLTGR